MKLKLGDYLIILFSIALAIALWLSFPAAGSKLTAVVYKDSKEVRRIVLTGLENPVEFDLNGAVHNRIIAENGRIRYEFSDCPDKTCVHAGWLNKAGQSAACLPNKTLIVIEGDTGSGVDAISN